MNFDDRLLLDDPKRRVYLMHLLSTGAAGLMPYSLASAGWFSSSPKRFSKDKSVFSLDGEAFVNDQAVNLDSRIRAGDTVKTSEDSEIIFVVGDDSFIMRSNSELKIEGSNFFIDSLRVLTGSLLSVFAKRESNQQLSMSASTATIGIRGSGVYVEVEPDQAYVCTCYGKITLASSEDPNDSEKITSKNHDEPRYISNKASKGTRIRQAPVINHTDVELKLLENIVGRDLPKGFGKGAYDR